MLCEDKSPVAKPPPWRGGSVALASNSTTPSKTSTSSSALNFFDFTVSPKLPAAILRDLAALRWLDTGESVILYGPVGVGKTMWHKPLDIK